MKAILLTLGAVLVLGVAVVGAAVLVQPASEPVAERAIVDPFKEPAKPAIVDPFKAEPVAAEGCPAGFADQGGLCVAEADADYQADTERRQDNEELAEAIGDELRGD